MWGSRDPVLEFWEPNNISRTVEARNFKFGTDTDSSAFQRIKCKIRSKGVMWASRDPVLEFWEPPNISRTVNFKFGAVSSNEEYAKLGQKW